MFLWPCSTHLSKPWVWGCITTYLEGAPVCLGADRHVLVCEWRDHCVRGAQHGQRLEGGVQQRHLHPQGLGLEYKAFICGLMLKWYWVRSSPIGHRCIYKEYRTGASAIEHRRMYKAKTVHKTTKRSKPTNQVSIDTQAPGVEKKRHSLQKS
jgi:hypothetical protein